MVKALIHAVLPVYLKKAEVKNLLILNFFLAEPEKIDIIHISSGFS